PAVDRPITRGVAATMARPSPAARQCGGTPIPRAAETERSTPGLLATMLPAAGLLAVTIAVYAPAAHFDFINLDDGLYVTANRRVQAGLSWQGIVWAFTTRHASHWHPLTWLSHMADCQLLRLDGWPLDLARTTMPAASVTEKLPLFVLAAAVSTLTFVVAASTGSVASLDVFPFPARLANALVAYCRYVGKALWPVRLAIFY